MAWDTAANIINDAAVELGLVSANIADPFASTDQNILQLCRLAKGVGQDLVRERAWTQLQREHTFSTAASTASYAFPYDFARLIDDTSWNRTQQLSTPAGVSPQAWQRLKASSSSGIVYRVMRTVLNEAQLDPTPSAVETIAYEYISRYWVVTGATLWAPSTAYTSGTSVVVNGARIYACDTSGTSASSGGPVGTAANITDGTTRWDHTTTGFAETTTAASDIWLFDRRLMVAALRLAFRDAKGFDTTSDLARYAAALQRAEGADGAAPVLSIGPGRLRLIDASNAPETGYGS